MCAGSKRPHMKESVTRFDDSRLLGTGTLSRYRATAFSS